MPHSGERLRPPASPFHRRTGLKGASQDLFPHREIEGVAQADAGHCRLREHERHPELAQDRVRLQAGHQLHVPSGRQARPRPFRHRKIQAAPSRPLHENPVRGDEPFTGRDERTLGRADLHRRDQDRILRQQVHLRLEEIRDEADGKAHGKNPGAVRRSCGRLRCPAGLSGGDQAPPHEAAAPQAEGVPKKHGHRIRARELETEDVPAETDEKTGRGDPAHQGLHEETLHRREPEQLLQDGQGRDLHADERRRHEERAAQARLQHPVRRGRAVRRMGDGRAAAERHDDAHPVP